MLQVLRELAAGVAGERWWEAHNSRGSSLDRTRRSGARLARSSGRFGLRRYWRGIRVGWRPWWRRWRQCSTRSHKASV